MRKALCKYASHLEHIGCSCRGEVHRFNELLFWVIFITVTLHHDCLSRALLTNQQHSLLTNRRLKND